MRNGVEIMKVKVAHISEGRIRKQNAIFKNELQFFIHCLKISTFCNVQRHFQENEEHFYIYYIFWIFLDMKPESSRWK